MNIARRLFTTFALATTLLVSAQTATAQITQITGSGCPTMPFPSFTGTGKIATKFTCNCPPSIDRMRVLIGLPSPRFPLFKPMMCISGCNIDMILLQMLNSGTLSATIPNEPTIVGFKVVAQCLQTSLNRPCLLLTGALEVKIQK